MKFLTSLLLVSAISVSVAAEDSIDYSAGYQTSAEVFEFGRKTQIVKSMLTNAGYQRQQCQEKPVYYYAEPQTNIYLKSTYTCTYMVPSPQMSFASDYAELSVEIFYNKAILLNHEGAVNVNYWTVY